MNLLWRDDFESFLDASAPDASGSSTSFANTVGPDTGFPSQPLLWIGIDPAPPSGADVNTLSLGGFDAGTASLPSGLSGQDTLWAEPRSGAATWQLADNAGDTGAMTLGTPTLQSSAGMPSDVGSLLWEARLFRFEKVSALANSSTVDSALNQALDVMWAATGHTGAPPVTLPHAPTNPFLDGSAVSLPPAGLVWPGEPPTNVVPDGTGQPPLTPPVAGDSPVNIVAGPTFASLASQQLVWIDPSTGAPTLFNDQSTAVLTQLNPLFSRA
jgi:hypothetical protein